MGNDGSPKYHSDSEISLDDEHKKSSKKRIESKNSRLKYKLDKLKANNGWNQLIEKEMKSLGEKSASFKWMHNKTATLYSDREFIWRILNIGFLLLIGGSLFIDTTNCNTNFIVKMTTGLITFLVTFSVNTYSSVNYEYEVRENKKTASQWSELYHNIKQQLSLNRRDRQYAKDYVIWIMREFDALSERRVY